MMNKAIFLDRDDTLIKDVPYNSDPSKVSLLPFAKKAVEKFRSNGFMLILITNQSGIGRRKITQQQMTAVNEEMFRQLEDDFDDVYFCPHTPDDGCDCRKPSPKMVMDAAAKHNINLTHSFLIGDKHADMLAAQNAGVKKVLVTTTTNDQTKARPIADFIADDLLLAANWICS